MTRAAPPGPSQPMTRRGCALGCLIWLVVMALPLVAFVFATQGELAWRRGPDSLIEDRLWLVDEPGMGGLAYLAARVTRDERPADGPLCVRTRVTFMLWRNLEGGDLDADFCACYAPDGGVLGSCAEVP